MCSGRRHGDVSALSHRRRTLSGLAGAPHARRTHLAPSLRPGLRLVRKCAEVCRDSQGNHSPAIARADYARQHSGPVLELL